MSYKAKYNEGAADLGVSHIKSNFLRRSIMIVSFVPLIMFLTAWNLLRAICWYICSIYIFTMCLGESVYINWNYKGDSHDNPK